MYLKRESSESDRDLVYVPVFAPEGYKEVKGGCVSCVFCDWMPFLERMGFRWRLHKTFLDAPIKTQFDTVFYKNYCCTVLQSTFGELVVEARGFGLSVQHWFV